MKPSGDPWTASGMKENNKRHETSVREFLATLVRDEKQHAKFLNMLSMLEHMGSRKIMVSQMNKGETMSQDTLQHLAEEARHAYFFKRHAERINGEAMDGWIETNTMCRVPALMYFGRMDAGITKSLAGRQQRQSQKCHPEQSEAQPNDVEGSHTKKIPPSLSPPSPPASGREGDGKKAADRGGEPYYWVSLIIELRACWLYQIYDEVVDEAGIHLPLKGLLAEEDGHLAECLKCAAMITKRLNNSRLTKPSFSKPFGMRLKPNMPPF